MVGHLCMEGRPAVTKGPFTCVGFRKAERLVQRPSDASKELLHLKGSGEKFEFVRKLPLFPYP